MLGLGHAYRVLLNTVQHPQEEEKGSAPGNHVTETAATTSPRTGAAVEPENQPMTVSVAPIQKKKYARNPLAVYRVTMNQAHHKNRRRRQSQ